MTEAEATAALVTRAQRGDADAFATLARKFLRAAYSVALAVVGRPDDAEDVAQDAFVLALQRIGTCRQPERFNAWLLQIVRNQALNWLARRRIRDVAVDDSSQSETVVALRPEHVGMRAQLLEALSQLSVVQREVVLLHDLEDWTHGEIAEALDISEGMSRQHLFHARRLLRARLGDYAIANE